MVDFGQIGGLKLLGRVKNVMMSVIVKAPGNHPAVSKSHVNGAKCIDIEGSKLTNH